MSSKAQYVKRKVGEKYLSSCIIQTFKKPTSVMIWAAICGKGMGRLFIVKEMKKFLPQLAEWFCPD